MKKYLKQALCIVVCLCLLCSAGFSAMADDTPGESNDPTNLIADGSFESGAFYNAAGNDSDATPGYWHNYTSQSWQAEIIESNMATDGSHLLQLKQFAFQVRQIVSVEANQWYDLSFMAKVNYGGVIATVYDVTNGERAIKSVTLNSAGDFGSNSLVFNSGSATQISVSFTTNGMGESLVFIDDVQLAETDEPEEPEDPTEPTNLVADGSFESAEFFSDALSDSDATPGYWHNYTSQSWQAGIFANGNATDGSYALQLKQYAFQVRQFVSIEPHTTYNFSFMAKVNNGGVIATVYDVTNGMGSATEIKSFTINTAGGFTEYSHEFNSGSTTEIAIVFTTNGMGDTLVFIDDVKLVETETSEDPEDPEDPTDPTNLVVDGSFESGTFYTTAQNDDNATPGYWHNYTAQSWNAGIYENGNATDGTHSLQLMQFAFQVRQFVNVKANQWYDFSFKVKVNVGGVIATVYDVTNGWSAIKSFTIKTAGPFTEYTHNFNSGSATTLAIVFSTSNISESLTFIDDVKLTEGVEYIEPVDPAVKSVNALSDGSFESGNFFCDTLNDSSTSVGTWHRYTSQDWHAGIFDNNNASEGSYALQLRQFCYKVRQVVDVTPNTNYNFSFMAKVSSGGTIATVSANGTVLATVSTDGSTTYKKYSASVNAGDAQQVVIEFTTSGISGDVLVFVDDVKLSKQFDVVDLVRTKKYLAGVTVSNVYDFDGNNKIELVDLMALKKSLLGIDWKPLVDVRNVVANAKYFYGTTDKDPLTYTVGDTITFDVSLYAALEKVSCPEIAWEVATDDGHSYSGKSDGYDGGITVTVPATGAGYVRLKVYANDEEGNMITDVSQVSHLDGPALFSAGVDVDTLTQTQSEPADFDSYWAGKVATLDDVAPDLLKYELWKEDSNYYYYIVKIAGTDETGYVSGYLTYPKNATANSLALRVVSFAYSSMDVYAHADPGYATLNIAPHSIELQQSASYYSNLSSGIYKNYGFTNNESLDTCYFPPMILRHLQGLRFLKAYMGSEGVMLNGAKQSLNLWNGTDILVSGGSQGGFLSLALAGLDSDVTNCHFDAAWMCDIGGAINSSKMNSCFRPAYTPALDYVDGLNFAKRISGKVITIKSGLGDYVCPPSGQTALFNILKGTNDVSWTVIQGHTHGFNPTQCDTYYYYSSVEE